MTLRENIDRDLDVYTEGLLHHPENMPELKKIARQSLMSMLSDLCWLKDDDQTSLLWRGKDGQWSDYRKVKEIEV